LKAVKARRRIESARKNIRGAFAQNTVKDPILDHPKVQS
jgi:hypothetical protein